MKTIGLTTLTLFYALVAIAHGQSSRDTREGEDVTLECRFSAEVASQEATYYWLRTNKRNQDNVAIKQTPLDTNYRLDFKPEQGKYDLHISNASYERDNGKFECKLKAAGSGRDLHSQSFVVTVLTPPGPPRVTPPAPTATEGKPFELTCSSAGGSPDPLIRWYREGVTDAIESVTRVGSITKDSVTSAILTVNPSRNDDGAIYKCVVWNRAMPEGMKLESKVTLAVHYYPRVEIGPENPVRVEKEGSVTLQCNVDSKPRVSNVRWSRNGRFIATSFAHTISKVTIQDSGKYTCTADNGLGEIGEAELTLDVQYPPQVTIDAGPGGSRQREAEEGETVNIQCNVSANPPPISVEWIREGRPEFRQSGEQLKIHRVSADSAGTYTCRAVNVLNPTTMAKPKMNRVGNSSVTLLVRHRPGQARISPEKPIGMEGAGVTLTCSASPPGWPMPQYRWWRDSDGLNPSAAISVLATGSRYTIQSVHLGSEGKYFCQATNEMGHGEVANVMLTVHQPPRIHVKLQPHVTRKSGESEYSVSCEAQGKPKPQVKWMKNDEEVSDNLFRMIADERENSNGIFTVQSTLKFAGRDRPNGNELLPSDSGAYSCVFENDVKKVESTMHLRVEHQPIILHKGNKVAFDYNENAEVVCKVQAYPRPEFQWYFQAGVSPLLAGSDGHYEINTTVNESGGDVFASVLQISNIRESDYGEYHCRVVNAVGSTRSTVRLQPKGPPESPEFLMAIEVGSNHVVLQWTPGFDGGIRSTRYFVSYRRALTTNDGDTEKDCFAPKKNGNYIENWSEFDCQMNNPCNITSLEQHQTYIFKVKAYNSKGQSNYSEEVASMTKVDKIPAPQRVTFNTETRTLHINVAATCLQLVGIVEAAINPMSSSDWRIIDTSLTLSPSGSAMTHQEATILSLVSRRFGNSRALEDNDYDSSNEDLLMMAEKPTDDVRIRVRLCLLANPETCGDYMEAEVGSGSMKEASTIAMPTMVAIVVSCIVFVLFVVILLVFCACRKNKIQKSASKEYGSSSLHAGITQQTPPPYYSTNGLENKGLEHSMDLVDSTKVGPTYGTQNMYSTYGNPAHGLNMAYLDQNSYSNSNNGGSVNSQDSLWQMKLMSVNGTSSNNDRIPPHLAERNTYGGYDPITHGGYNATDDFSPYPATPDQLYMQNYGQDLERARDENNRLESPYDLNGMNGLPLPNTYLDHGRLQEGIKQQPAQNLSISYEESLESGFSTPNSRNRRIIREIIV